MNAINTRRPDGAHWERQDRGDCQVLLTEAGRQLLQTNTSVERSVQLYLAKATGGVDGDVLDGVRTFFGKDSNSHVYTLASKLYGNNILVKETNGHSMEHALDRMDRISYILQEMHLPAWIGVPDHYGVISGDRLPTQYVAMQGIDSGINVRDILFFNEHNAKERAGIESIIGRVTADVVVEVAAGFDEAKRLLDNAIAEATYQNPDTLLSDWHEGNVVLESLIEPIDGQTFKYWVIDQ